MLKPILENTTNEFYTVKLKPILENKYQSKMGFKLGIYCLAIIGMRLTPVNLYLLCMINY